MPKLYLTISAAVECSSLSSPDNGAVVYSGDTLGRNYEGTVATYVCDNLYAPSSTLSRTCGAMSGMGVWSGSASTCNRTFSYTV